MGARCARKGGGSLQGVIGNPCAGAGPRCLRLRPLLRWGRLRGLELSTRDTNSASEVAKPSPSFDELGVVMHVACFECRLSLSLSFSLRQRLCGPGMSWTVLDCHALVR